MIWVGKDVLKHKNLDDLETFLVLNLTESCFVLED